MVWWNDALNVLKCLIISKNFFPKSSLFRELLVMSVFEISVPRLGSICMVGVIYQSNIDARLIKCI